MLEDVSEIVRELDKAGTDIEYLKSNAERVEETLDKKIDHKHSNIVSRTDAFDKRLLNVETAMTDIRMKIFKLGFWQTLALGLAVGIGFIIKHFSI